MRAFPHPIPPALLKSTPTRRQLRQLYRAWIRGELPERTSATAGFFVLGPYFTSERLFRDQARTRAAHNRQMQSSWLFMKQREMEDRLEQLGLPRDCWSQGWDFAVWDHEPDPKNALGFVINSSGNRRPPTLWRWIQHAQGERAWEGYCTAYAAWIAHHARRIRGPELRMRFGRLLTACEANVVFPSRVREAQQSIPTVTRAQALLLNQCERLARATADRVEESAARVRSLIEEFDARIARGERSKDIIAAMAEDYRFTARYLRSVIRPRSRIKKRR